MCAGYVSIEGAGQWEWDMSLEVKDAFIYVKDNGDVHRHLCLRAFGSYVATDTDYSMIDITGRELARTWSLLLTPVQSGDTKITLMHNDHIVGW